MIRNFFENYKKLERKVYYFLFSPSKSKKFLKKIKPSKLSIKPKFIIIKNSHNNDFLSKFVNNFKNFEINKRI